MPSSSLRNILRDAFSHFCRPIDAGHARQNTANLNKRYCFAAVYDQVLRQVAEDGSYTLQLAESLRLPVGVYAVGVTSPPPPNMSTEEAMRVSMEKKNDSQLGAIPSKYQNPNTSPLKLEVVEGENLLDVKMTSK